MIFRKFSSLLRKSTSRATSPISMPGWSSMKIPAITKSTPVQTITIRTPSLVTKPSPSPAQFLPENSFLTAPPAPTLVAAALAPIHFKPDQPALTMPKVPFTQLKSSPSAPMLTSGPTANPSVVAKPTWSTPARSHLGTRKQIWLKFISDSTLLIEVVRDNFLKTLSKSSNLW